MTSQNELQSNLIALNKQLQSLSALLIQRGQELNKALQNLPFDELAKGIKSCFENLPNDIKIISSQNWFINFDTLPWELRKASDLILSGKILEADEIFCDSISKSLHEIEARLIRKYPERSSIFQECFRLYYNTNYFGAITLIHSQVDGICYDSFNKFFYRNNRSLTRKGVYRPDVLSEIENYDQFLQKHFLSLFDKTPVVIDSIENLHPSQFKFNRHAILHGRSVDFGTKKNCLKTISLLAFVECMLSNKE